MSFQFCEGLSSRAARAVKLTRHLEPAKTSESLSASFPHPAKQLKAVFRPTAASLKLNASESMCSFAHLSCSCRIRHPRKVLLFSARTEVPPPRLVVPILHFRFLYAAVVFFKKVVAGKAVPPADSAQNSPIAFSPVYLAFRAWRFRCRAPQNTPAVGPGLLLWCCHPLQPAGLYSRAAPPARAAGRDDRQSPLVNRPEAGL